MKLTKERVAIFVLSVLLLLSLVTGLVIFLRMSREHRTEREAWEAEREVFEKATTGEFIERDGLWQDSLIYLTDFSVNLEEEYVICTMKINHSGRTHIGADPYLIQFKQDGEWVFLPSSQETLEEGSIEISWNHGPFTQETGFCDLPAEKQLPGEYRMVKRIGTNPNDNYRGIFAVGYFSIP